MNYTVKRLLVHSTLLAIAIGIGFWSTIERIVDPTIPINLVTNTIGLFLFVVWLVLPVVLGWIGKGS